MLDEGGAVVKKLISRDLTQREYDMLDDMANEGDPKIVVPTGLDGSQGATELHVYSHLRQTFVVPCGEYQNAEPWVFDSNVTPAFVLREYLKVMRKAS